MPEGQVLSFSGLTKHFGAVTAVADLTAQVEPGRVTGFLGPNGAGKTTTLRILLGLVRASSGTATIGGQPYAALKHPLQTVGAALEASSFHPGRTAANHLKVYAQAAQLPVSRVDEVLALVGLADVAGRKVGGFSLGMRQRLALAYTLLGDPGVLVLDEPANGLDPEGIKWLRGFLRELAREGRTVLVSSHMLSEVQQTVDSLLVISRGRLVFQGELENLADPSEYATVVDSPDRAALSAALTASGVEHEVLRSGLTVRGLDTTQVGAIAASAGVALSGLQRRGPALEEVFLGLVDGTRTAPVAAVAAPVDAAAPIDEAPPVEQAIAEVPPVEEAAPVEPMAPVEDGIDEPVPHEADANDERTGPIEPVAEPAESTDAAPQPDATAPVAATPPTSTAAFADASTGVIDIVPGMDEASADSSTDDDGVIDADEIPLGDLPEDADVDVEAIGRIDAELSDDHVHANDEGGQR